MLQYKIPQNVGIEDKIVGPLTLRQLLILAGGFGISYVLFALLNKLYELNMIEYAVIALPGLLSAAFALVKINDIPLTKYLFLFMEFAIKPKKRVWDHRGISSLVAPELDEAPSANVSELEMSIAERKAKQASNLAELTRMLDSGFENVREVKHNDIDNTKDDDLVTEAYFGNKRGESPTENMYWRTKDSQMKRLKILASLPVTQLKKGTKETEIAKEQIMNAKREAEAGGQKPSATAVAIQQKPAPKPEQKPQPSAQTINMRKPMTDKVSNIQINPKPVIKKQEEAKEVKKPEAKPEARPAQTLNQAKPIQTPKIQPQQKPAIPQTAQIQPAHKKRKRNRHHSKPVRENNQINTINKNAPAKYVPGKQQANQTNQKPAQQKPQPIQGKQGEFDFRELQKGEIEINLD